MGADTYPRMFELLSRPAGEGRGAWLRLGRVRSVEPLSVSVGGTDIPAQCLMVDGDALAGAGRKVILTAGPEVFAGTLTAQESAFRAGDLAVMITEDDQTFFILGRGVPAV